MVPGGNVPFATGVHSSDLFELVLQCTRRADSLAACTAGNNAIRTPMIA